MQAEHSRTPIISAIILNAAAWAGITLSRTQIDVLFLSTYETAWLPTFFLGQTLVILLITALITPIAAKGQPKTNFGIFSFSALSIVVGHLLLRFEIPGSVFIFCLWLSASPILLLVISLNTISDAFDVRRFKKLILWINIAGNLSGVFTGLVLIPLMVKVFGAGILIYALAAVSIGAGVASLYLPPTANLPTRSTQAHSPYNYPLFRIIALCTFFLMVVDTFADYALKAELAHTYSSKEDIGSFMGPFYGISNALMLVVQLAGTQMLLKLFGIVGLLSVVPLFTSVGSAALFFVSSLWTAVILRMGETVFRFGFFSVGRELALKPLPAQIRRTGKFHITSAGYLGAGLGSVLLLVFAEYLGLQAIAVLMLITSLFWLLMTRRVHNLYQDTLEEAIRIKRFNVGDDGALLEQQDNVQGVTSYAFKDKDPGTIRFGFTLLERLHSGTMPEVALPHLNAESATIRIGFIRATYALKDRNMVPLLLERQKIEQDSKTLWWLLKTLNALAPEQSLEAASEHLHSPSPLARAGSVVILLSHGTLDHVISAANMLKSMVTSSDPEMRRGAAYAISGLKQGKLHDELHALLEDPDDKVSIAAIWAVADRHSTQFIPALTARLGHGRVSHYAARTLMELGEPTVPHLLALIEEGQSQTSMRAAVRILVRIRCEQADQAIVQAAKTGDVLTRSLLAKECALRAKKQANSNYLAQHARHFVFQEAHNVRLLKDALLSKKIIAHAKAELDHRRKMAEARLLYWFDVCTQSIELLGIIPVLLSNQDTQTLALKHATALEFLENLTQDQELKRAIGSFEYPGKAENAEKSLQQLSSLNDHWLNQALQTAPQLAYKDGNCMDITAKVMLLRRVKLFADLPGEILLTIAETCEAREIVKNEKLFAQGAFPDGMYIVASGTVGIEKDGKLVGSCKEFDFFGEIGLFDESPRMADAVVIDDGMVLFLQKEVFDGITEDLPEVLRALVRTVIGYLH